LRRFNRGRTIASFNRSAGRPKPKQTECRRHRLRRRRHSFDPQSLSAGLSLGGRQTASGELYDPTAWTAAIKTNLRERFGGVRYAKNYRPTYALLSSQDKQVIVKVNDVGPLEPGRVVDLNEQTMRYFDPDMQRGLITITPLRGADWLPGPVTEQQLMSVAGLQYVRMRLAGLGKVLGICDL
jgi:hypothetical protein